MARREPRSEDDPLYAEADRLLVVDGVVLAALRLSSWIAYLVPWRVWVAGTFLVALASMATSSHRRRVALTNVRHIRRGRMPPAPVAWCIGAEQIATHFRAVIGTLRAGARLPDEAGQLVIENLAGLEPYLGQRGIVVVAVHAGPYPMLGLLARHWLRGTAFGGQFAVVARLFRPFRSGALMEWFIERFGHGGITIIPVHETPSVLANKLIKVLEAKGMIALMVDEPTPTPSLAVSFFDSAIKLPIGPVRLARAMGSVIVPVIASYDRGGRIRVTIADAVEPTRSPAESLERIAGIFEGLIARRPGQWAMLTPVWPEPAPEPPAGFAYADLHLHTAGSDGLRDVDDWVAAMPGAGIGVVAVTDHDHIETIRRWRSDAGPAGDRVLPGVELTARGRIVHLGVLFPDAVPTRLPKPGTPLVDLVRWARSIPGSVVVLVHPLPFLWRGQLRRLAAAGLLPDAIESRFPFVGNRTAAIEDAAARYGLAVLGGSDAHMAAGQLGHHVTLFPGETADDLVAAIRARTTRSLTRPVAAKVPLAAYAWQSLSSWLLPFRVLPLVPRLRAALVRRARQRTGDAAEVATTPSIRPEPERERRVS